MHNALLIFAREVRDQLRDKRTLFMLIVLPLMLYPALGIGMIQATLLFNEQPRNVVVLGADELPETSLLNATEDGRTQIDPQYFGNADETDKLIVSTDADLRAASGLDTLTPESLTDLIGSPGTEPGTRRQAEMLDAAIDVAGKVEELDGLKGRIGELLGQQERAQTDAATEPLTVEQEQTLTNLSLAADALAEQISARLAIADIQILLIVPDGFRDDLAAFNAEVVTRRARAEDEPPIARPQPRLVQNTADEKSRAAVGRVQNAIRAWEQRLLSERLREANLPSELVEPVSAQPLDVARSEERAANVWSRLFPFLLVLMSVTGAFYPAIDLGAGEKERGTMETLLICPATRGEIVAGKFFTVFSFSLITTVLNIASMGLTGGFLTDLAAGGGAGGLELPPASALGWVLLLALPMAAMFSALSLALAMFARSSKEGQYYLTPLVTVTIGLAVFAASPLVSISPFYSVLPVVGPALLLKGLLSPGAGEGLVWFLPVVLLFSTAYSVLALWWAREQFNREEILFREAEQFDVLTWLKQLVTERDETPSIAEAGVCFFVIMVLQLAAMKLFRPLMLEGTAQATMTALVMQQTLMMALPAILFGALLTANLRKTFLLFAPNWKLLAAAAALPLLLHPLSVEMGAFLSEHFFEPLPESFAKGLEPMTNGSVPLLVAVAVFALTPAICEEIAFRGFLLTGFNTRKQYWGAIIGSALCFGIVHMIPQQVFNAALLGLVLGLLAVRSGSLLPGMLFHLMYNSLEVLRSRTDEASLSFARLGESMIVQVGDDPGVRYGWLLLTLCGGAAAAILTWLVRQPPNERFFNDRRSAHRSKPKSLDVDRRQSDGDAGENSDTADATQPDRVAVSS